jgi:hypothetical protein
MPAPIPETTKSKVIEMWLLGSSRDSIASANNISTGAVSNIVKEWEDRIGKNVMRGLREIGALLKREGLSPAQCAIGFRIMKMFADQGVDGEAAEHFVSGMYGKCNRLGITPSNIVTHIDDLTKFSKEENVRLAEIKVYMEKKIVEKKELDDKLEKLNGTVATLEQKASELKKSCDTILEQNRRAEYEMKLFFSSKVESMANDIPQFVSTVNSIAEYGYDAHMVLDEFRDIQYHQDKLRAYKIAIDEAQKRYEKLESQNSSLLKRISLHSSKADLYNELDVAGFGIAELRRLLDTITNIATSNQISHWVAIDKFFSDLDQYDAKLGFESAKNRISTEIKLLDAEREKKLENLRNQPFIGPVIGGLLKLGLNDTDIIENTKKLYIILKSSSIKDIALSTIEAVEEMATNHKRTATIDDEVIEILGRAKEELSRLD